MRLLTEQKKLKDSTNRINERIGIYFRKGAADSAALLKKQLGAAYGRLAEIQAMIDHRTGLE